jgi:hypothetical protein
MDANHTYFWNGKEVAGVTRSLQQAKIIDFSGIPQRTLDKAAERGRRVHAAFELYDLGTLDESSLDDEIAGHLKAYKAFERDTKFVPGLIEGPRFHETRHYAGRFDRTGVMGNDLVLLDFKSGAFQDGYFVQIVGGYGNFFPNPRRFRYLALQTKANGTYKVHEASASKFEYYTSVFLSAVTCAQFNLHN